MERIPTPENTYWLIKPKRWFLFSAAGLIGLLLGSILLATLILLRTGKEPRQALVIGNSMEPTLIGPAKSWDCESCSTRFRFALESINPNQPLICPFCQSVSSTPVYELFTEKTHDVLPHETVKYHVRSFVASRRQSAGENTVFRGLKRGDLVVFNAPDLDRREIKRIVGFPGERIEIKSGDLWVNGQRWRKDMAALLNQSILLADSTMSSRSDMRWETRAATTAQRVVLKPIDESTTDAPSTADEQNRTMGSLALRFAQSPHLSPQATSKSLSSSQSEWIDNRLVSNLHDSHCLIPVKDIGIALQLGTETPQWTLSVDFQSVGGHTTVVLNRDGSNWEGVLGDEKKQRSAPEVTDANVTEWLVVAMVDGDLVVSLNKLELFRWRLEENREIASVLLKCLAGSIEITERLAFRDIEYRGAGDSASQAFEEQGIVLVGDNVSLSFDSRDRWPEGLSADSITGVVELPQTGIENLLRQRVLLPRRADHFE